ncbi:hypothetical protein PV327_007503 [Microctonus hyperodae]|uniref:Uncharacterized protein n=1 Tax=Microctonus hyperodae TaxID=165561 RepID=A0AA39FZB2_MICHY|nr:hypothetical protein PV327_007503 [Microctonus hyperodae]
MFEGAEGVGEWMRASPRFSGHLVKETESKDHGYFYRWKFHQPLDIARANPVELYEERADKDACGIRLMLAATLMRKLRKEGTYGRTIWWVVEESREKEIGKGRE